MYEIELYLNCCYLALLFDRRNCDSFVASPNVLSKLRPFITYCVLLDTTAGINCGDGAQLAGSRDTYHGPVDSSLNKVTIGENAHADRDFVVNAGIGW